MVQDGTKCSDQKICMNQTCVSTSPLKSYMRCPVDTSNMECSGRGVSYWVWFDANILYLLRKVLGCSEYYPSRVISMYFLEYHAKLPKLIPTYISSTTHKYIDFLMLILYMFNYIPTCIYKYYKYNKSLISFLKVPSLRDPVPVFYKIIMRCFYFSCVYFF